MDSILLMNETTKNFWAAWALSVELPKPVFFRLYHDNDGNLLFYSMEDVPGNYIEIDHATFAVGSPRVRVVNGKLQYIKTGTVLKLMPTDSGQACDPSDVAVVTTGTNKKYWKLKTSDEEN